MKREPPPARQRPGTLSKPCSVRERRFDYGCEIGVIIVQDGTNKEGKVIQMSTWTFITNHARVMMVITQDPTVRLRDIASSLDITERAAQRIVTELVDEGYLSRKREGRRNTYTVHPNKPLRAAQASDTEIGEFIDLLLDNQKQKPLALAS